MTGVGFGGGGGGGATCAPLPGRRWAAEFMALAIRSEVPMRRARKKFLVSMAEVKLSL